MDLSPIIYSIVLPCEFNQLWYNHIHDTEFRNSVFKWLGMSEYYGRYLDINDLKRRVYQRIYGMSGRLQIKDILVTRRLDLICGITTVALTCNPVIIGRTMASFICDKLDIPYVISRIIVGYVEDLMIAEVHDRCMSEIAEYKICYSPRHNSIWVRSEVLDAAEKFGGGWPEVLSAAKVLFIGRNGRNDERGGVGSCLTDTYIYHPSDFLKFGFFKQSAMFDTVIDDLSW